MNIDINTIISICNGNVINIGKSSYISKFCSDTRKIKKGDLFICLSENSANGKKYIVEALEKGASGIVTAYDVPVEIMNLYNDRFIIQVNDVIVAIQEIAKYKRSLYNIPVVAVTGSVGKTSTKDMIACVLEQKYKIKKTEGNLNNHIGLPLTILNWDEDTEVAVVEMGMNHFGEIDALTNIAKPTVSVITNIGTAHIGNLGSRENILKAKLEILNGMNKNGVVIINNDNDLLNTCDTRKFHKITYGIHTKSEYMAHDIRCYDLYSKCFINDLNEDICIPVAGEHFIYNSLCAIAVGIHLGLNFEECIAGIKNFKVTGDRNKIIEENNLKIIDDYYNASYDSMKASLEVLAKLKNKRTVAILGDMLELGEHSEILHRKVGAEVAKNKIDVLCTIGKMSKNIAKEAENLGTKEIYLFDSNEECIKEIKNIIKKGDCILLKASNMMNFGEISNYLKGENLWKN